jgi:23S rRNA (guanosine2251-2'-O)-methyltransferase
MVGRHRKLDLLGNHQSSWVWGSNVIQELLRSKWLPLEVLVDVDLEGDVSERVAESSKHLGIRFQKTTRERLTQLCKATDHQGLLAKMPAFPYTSLDQLIQETGRDRRLIVLDGIQDSFNLGAICRSAEIFGVDGVILGDQNQVGVNSQVVRSAAGAVCRLNIAKSENLIETLQQLNSKSVKTLATSPQAEVALPDANLSGSIAIVIGNEGVGVRPEVIRECHSQLRIPQLSDFDSLNAAVATGVILYEVARQDH